MKKLVTIIVTVAITFVATMAFAMVRFGGFNVSSHTDHYVTTCNGQIVSESNKVVTDEVSFNVSVDEAFTLFSR